MNQRRDGEWWLRGLPVADSSASAATADPQEPLAPLRPRLLRAALGLTVVAFGSGVAMILAFDSTLGSVIGGGLAGTMIWGAVSFFTDTRKILPRGELRAPPVDAVVLERGHRWSRRDFVVLGALVPGLALIAILSNEWDLGGLFVPGQFAGYAADSLLAVVLIRRFERSQGVRILSIDGGAAKPLYAVPARA